MTEIAIFVILTIIITIIITITITIIAHIIANTTVIDLSPDVTYHLTSLLVPAQTHPVVLIGGV